ncbi:hypothetical protein [Bacillus sp. Brlt_9]|uniref:hypothetical protein n=1 Tax=Bacillus sp. Brlt_9 TaxID=3110916 RepID=UPI003F7B4859
MSTVTVKLYLSGEGVAKLQNTINRSVCIEEVKATLNKTKEYFFEAQVPIEMIGNIYASANYVILYPEKYYEKNNIK